MKSVYLCGFMGCGKSTVGKILAKKLGVEFYDLDAYIEKKAGMKISEIFKNQGEEHFRHLESEALRDFKDKKGVVATGGGALLSEENAQIAQSAGISVFIDTDFEICYGRIKGDKKRPIAYNSTKEELSGRFQTRYPLYKAHSKISCNGNNSPTMIADEIYESVKLF